MMDTTALPLEFELSCERFDKTQDRIVRDFGFGDTEGALAISRKFIPQLAEAFSVELKRRTNKQYNKELKALVSNLSPEIVALCSIQSCLHSIAMGDQLRDTMLLLGSNLAAECWGAKLTNDNPRLAQRIERHVRLKHGNYKYRKQAARSIAQRAGFKSKRWSREQMLQAGSWMLNVTIACLDDVFTLVDGDHSDNGEKTLTLSADALSLAEAAMAQVIMRNPVFLPMRLCPKPWTGWSGGASHDDRVNYAVTVLRSPFKDTASAVKYAIKTGQMQPALDALNVLQSVAWKINTKVLNVMQACIDRGIAVEGLPRKEDLPKPVHDKPWEKMDEGEKKLWKYRANEIEKANRGFTSDRVLLAEDMQTAKLMADSEKFWTPMNMDWRGRVYGLCHFNFQREDKVRSLFLFADGEPIGEDGLWYLKLHTANCGDFDKITKQSLQARVDWTDSHLTQIQQVADDALSDSSLSIWTKADKPFLFLASCFELSQAIASPSRFVTHLPISFDGSCSGLQHLSAMTRAAEGQLVNLVTTELPQDVYQTVADATTTKLKSDAAEGNQLATMCLEYGVTRKVVKRNVMTFPYSSKKFGMAEQQRTDLMQPLSFDVLQGKLTEHPFGVDDGFVASKYLASCVYDSIQEIVALPAQAMKFLQSIAKAMAHEGKPVRWTTPVGIPWINRYHEPTTRRVNLWMHDRGVKLKYQVKLAVDVKPEIDKNKAANGVAPNFVHALDAAHLLLTAKAAAAEGITAIATVHDSFGCLANHARRFNEIIREQFVLMYELNDVLTQVREQSFCDLTPANQHKLPDVLTYGPLKLNGVLNAPYAFS